MELNVPPSATVNAKPEAVGKSFTAVMVKETATSEAVYCPSPTV